MVVFLDENDSEFGSYIIEALRTDINVFSYYAFFHYMKQRQHILTQSLLSLLFLEAINIRTGKSFAEEVMALSQRSRRLVKKYKISGRLGEVFEAFLLGSPVRRQISAKFLKCMRCDGSELKKIGMYRDLSNSRNLAFFFSDVMKCFEDKKASVERGFQRPIIMCFCNVPVLDLSIVSLNRSGLGKILSTTKRPIVKFWLVSQGDLREYSFQKQPEMEKDLAPLVQFERIPLLYRKESRRSTSRVVRPLDLAGLSRHIISELGKQSIIAPDMEIKELISDRILEEFLEIVLSGVDVGLRVSKFSVDFSSLIELVLQKYPKALTSKNIKDVFLQRRNG